MDVARIEQWRLDAEIDGTAADIGGRGRNRFLHDLFEVAGDDHLALAGHHHAFDGEQLTTDLGPGKAGHTAHLILGFRHAEAILGRTEIFLDLGLVDQHGLHRLVGARREQDFLHRLADEIGNLALEITDTRFPRVAAHQKLQRIRRDRPFLVVETMLLERVGNEMLAGDLGLLVLGVAGDTDDLHAIHERTGDVQRVRRGHEHDVREVVVHLEVMVVERGVLLGIEHFQKCARGIAAEILPHLVDFIEQEERVGGLRLAQGLDDLARHRTDIGPAMATDLRLVAHAAERHADELAARGLRDRLAERGLADTRRADKAQDRPGELVRAALYREILDDAVLDLVEAEVIGVEDLLRKTQVLLHLRALAPGQREHPVEVVAHDRGFRRHR